MIPKRRSRGANVTPPSSSARDAGLTRVVGPFALAATVVSLMVGAAIFAVPADLSRTAGSLAPAIVLLCAIAVGAIGLCFAAGSSRVPSSGGIYALIEEAFGDGIGFVSGMLLNVSNVLASGAVCAALADAIASIAPPPAQTVVRIATVFGSVAGISAINIRGIVGGARLVSLSTVLKLAPLLLILCAGVFRVRGANLVRPTAVSPEDMGRAMLLMLFAFQGFEGALSASGEVRDPTKSIPRALLLGIGAVALLYAGLQFVAQGLLGPALAHSKVPLADAIGVVHPALRSLILATAAISMFGWMSSDLMASPRILFAFGRDGSLPRLFGMLNRRRSPYVAIACYGSIEIALALSGSFADLAEGAALILGALYIVACAASWELDRRDVRNAGAPLRFRGLGLAAVIGCLSMFAVIVVSPRGQILGLLALTAITALLYLFKAGLVRRRRAVTLSGPA
jgi:basic amino acid/polyamine antiporter, APA family